VTPTLLATRVTTETVLVVLLLALPAAWLGGVAAFLGVVAGGVLAVGNFWWLTGRALMAVEARPRLGWPALALLRFAVLGGAGGILLWTGLAHPVAMVVGLTVLPCAVVVRGLRAAGETG
jgi:hypothetical protein